MKTCLAAASSLTTLLLRSAEETAAIVTSLGAVARALVAAVGCCGREMLAVTRQSHGVKEVLTHDCCDLAIWIRVVEGVALSSG
jgi:hypothetical protein